MERVADYIIRKLTEENIKHIFLITGRGILYLTDAVAKNNNINAVSTYHEQGASYAAMAYAAATEGMGACLVSTGCAATNAVTAALCAWQDNLPVVFISGQNMLNETTRYTNVPIRTYGSQEADIIKIVESITKYAQMITRPEDIVYEMEKAVFFANHGRKGPVWLDVPLDIQNARIDTDSLKHYEALSEEPKISNEDLKYVAESLQNAKRPVIFIGGGVRSAGAGLELRNFVEENKIPVVFSTSAADIYGSANQLSIGAVGSLGGSRAGNFTVQNADLVLAIGTKLCAQSVGNYEEFAREARIIAVDIDEHEHTKKGVTIDKIIHGDAKTFIQQLSKQKISIQCTEWIDKCLGWKQLFDIKNEDFIKEALDNEIIDLYYFADVLKDVLEKDTVVITDAGFEELIVPSAVKYGQEQKCLFPAAQGAMGYAIPAIIGAYYAGKNSIVTVVGDGSFMMNMQELQLIGANKIPAKIFVINNNMYAVIRKRQRDLFRTRTIGNDPSDGVSEPDFERIANSFNIDYMKIADSTELEQGLKETMKKSGPCICEVFCSVDQKYLHTSFAINDKRRLVRRPLEDLSPFIDREVLKEEMIVEAINP